MKKVFAALFPILLVVLICCVYGESKSEITKLSDSNSLETSEYVTTDNVNPSVNYAEKLLSCELDEIREIEITKSTCENGKIMYKSLTSDADKRAFIDILKKIEVSTEPLSVPIGVMWGFSVRVLFENSETIWVYRYNTTDSDTKALTIGNSVYEVKDEDTFEELIHELYNSIEIKEAEWVA